MNASITLAEAITRVSQCRLRARLAWSWLAVAMIRCATQVQTIRDVMAWALVLCVGLLLTTTVIASFVGLLRRTFDLLCGDTWLYSSHGHALVKLVSATRLAMELGILAALAHLLVTLFLN